MINTYAEYLETPRSIDFKQMEQIHKMILEEVSNDDDALELYDELIEVATKYGAIRAKWMLMSREEKIKQDSSRSSCHNSVIIHFNMLARYLRMQGKSAKWRELLGDENKDRYFRKTIGDFGCYLVFVNSICAR